MHKTFWIDDFFYLHCSNVCILQQAQKIALPAIYIAPKTARTAIKIGSLHIQNLMATVYKENSYCQNNYVLWNP